MKTNDDILTSACAELALLLLEQTSTLLNTTTPADRWKLKQSIADTHDIYYKLLQGLRT